MNTPTRELVDAAASGQPVYISDVRRRFAALPPAGSWELLCSFLGLGGAVRAYPLRLPRLEALPADERVLSTEYLLSTVYNVLSTIGGTELRLSSPGDPPAVAELARTVEQAFGLALPRRERPGYGRAANVAERMNEAVAGGGAARFRCTAARHDPVPAGAPRPAAGAGILAMCRGALAGLDRRVILGMDIGGTDIKLALAVRGSVVRFMEYDWFPASFTTIDELVRPIVLLTRLLRLEALRASRPAAAAALGDLLEPALAGGADLGRIAGVLERAEPLCAAEERPFDAIGLCFPDVVVRDKIVGGEVYKTRGIRENPALDYEREFRKLSHLDVELAAFVRQGGVVANLNDGPMAAFTAAVEMAAVDPGAVERGVFAHTLGTELGTGWVTEAGEIPDIPLEVYNCIVDLGSYPERRFHPDDVRSVNNFNTRLPGTLQKYASQSGVFRLAAKYLPRESPALWQELLDKGLLVERGDSLRVPTEPRDQRKPLLELLMRVPERGGQPAVERIFREVGESLAVAFAETELILAPQAKGRILFGRLVKHRPCFELILAGARRLEPSLSLSVADDELASTPFMKALKERPGYTVAQFAQAIGAVHYANFRLGDGG